MRQARAETDGRREGREAVALREIRKAIQSIKHGAVTVFVQDGIVIQIDRTDKLRMDYSHADLHQDGHGI